MNVRLPVPRSFTNVMTGVFILWFGSYAYRYIYSQGGPEPLYSYSLLVAFSAFCLMRFAAGGRGVPGTSDRFFRAFMGWLAAYLAYGIFASLLTTQDAITVQTFIIVCESITLMGAFALLIAGLDRAGLVVMLMAWLALLATLLGLYDFIFPAFSEGLGRSSGLYRKPNVAGLMIAMTMVAGIFAVPARWRLQYVIACGLGILVTFSRAAFILWGLGVIGLGWQGAFGVRKRNRRIVAMGIIIAGGAMTTLLFSGTLGELVQGSAVQKYLTHNTAARLGIGATVLSGGSTNERTELVKEALHSFLSAPLFGHGLGYTDKWSNGHRPHNEYMLFLVEGGVLGLALYLTLMALLWYASFGIGRLLTLQTVVIGLFTHNLLEAPGTLLMMAFIVAHGAQMRKQKRNQTMFGLEPG